MRREIIARQARQGQRMHFVARLLGISLSLAAGAFILLYFLYF